MDDITFDTVRIWQRVKAACVSCHLDPATDVVTLCTYVSRLLPGDLYLEIGTWMGGSAAIAALTSVNGVIIRTIDSAAFHEARWKHNKSEYLAILQRNFALCGVEDKIEVSLDGSEGTDWTDGIDLLFIDGNHSPAGVSADATKWLPLVKENGVALFHDYALYSGVKRVVDALLQNGWRQLPGSHNMYAITRGERTGSL